jgi:dTDP-4-dehydrorhamnose reductase
MSASDKNLVIRTGWIFGNNGINFLTSMLSKASSGDVIDVISDCYGSPCYSADLADALVELIDQEKNGIYNICNAGKCSWADFAYAAAKYSKFDFKIKSWKFGDQKFIDFPMPKFTALSSHKYAQDTGKKMRPWKTALKECLKGVG